MPNVCIYMVKVKFKSIWELQHKQAAQFDFPGSYGEYLTFSSQIPSDPPKVLK